ncbi:hypothetical protein COU80_05840 [Candidatus Peregrinibacteria bacterium CG10_big_fil_rev_8_21_14_0_10_55_24]|nr:MAG: hypothetical protein COU80_05840 [Candidatus Peregrinibacteria bacterium CG10_big_fil_rev_8_21_14_0_10_55_24]
MKRNWTMEQVAAHWDSVPEYNDINAQIDSYYRRFVDSAPLFSIPQNAKVLDVDCRTAVGTTFFARKYPTARFTCMPMAPSFATAAGKKISGERISANIVPFASIPLPFDDEVFDVVLTYETIEHVPWPEAYLAELSRVLKTGGTLVLTTPSLLWEPVHLLSAALKLDHGEGPHWMLARGRLLRAIREAGLDIKTERSFVLIPVGPKWLIAIGKSFERVLPEFLLRILCLRRTFICTKRADYWWHRLNEEIIRTGLDTHCGTSVGVSNGLLELQEKDGVPVTVRTSKPGCLPREAFLGCAARECNYPKLNKFVFGELPENWLCGVVKKSSVGHASDETVRRTGASGGVISSLLIHLIESGAVNGAVCLQLGKNKPYRAEPVIARSREEVLACAQSIYSLTPVNTILSKLEREEGPLAYVGLPDQVAAIRKLQMLKHPSVRNIRYIIGPYMGTQMYFEAIRSFLRSHDVRSEEEITYLKYRAGEWPGHLRIALKDGRVLTAEKFHYNYLIPFFITQSSLQLVDFTNELTDISVGDAWSPMYEKKRGGYAVILARSQQGQDLIEAAIRQNILSCEPVSLEEALDMHGHMLDFKKRGSFIRNSWRKVQPEYGYAPAHIAFMRVAVEWCLCAVFSMGKQRSVRWLLERIPLRIVGPAFNILRKSWKAVSKPTKRKGLRSMEFRVCSR